MNKIENYILAIIAFPILFVFFVVLEIMYPNTPEYNPKH